MLLSRRLMAPEVAVQPETLNGLGFQHSLAPGNSVDEQNLQAFEPNFISEPAAFRMTFTGLDGSNGGLILESGGTTTDFYVGFRTNGDFVARVGNASSSVSGNWDVDTGYFFLANGASTIVGDGTLEVFVEGSPGSFSLRVFWNGVELTATASGVGASLWAGTGGMLNYLVADGETAIDEVTTIVTYATASDLRIYSVKADAARVDPGIAEDGLTVTTSISVGNDPAPNITENSLVLAANINGLDGSAGGLVIEDGGNGFGMYVGFDTNGDFVARCGSGAARWASDTGYLLVDSANAPAGDGVLVVEFANGKLWTVRAWWNDVELSGTSQTATGSNNFAGNDQGRYLGAQNNTIPVGEVGTVVTFTEASSLRYYSNQGVL